MTKSTYEMARGLGIHPANLFLYLAEQGVNLGDAWPTIDEDWIVAIQSRYWDRFGGKSVEYLTAGKSLSVAEPCASIQVSTTAAIIIEKLWRSNKWGHAIVNVGWLQKHTHLPGQELQNGIDELSKCGLLIGSRGSRVFSLNSSRRGEIEAIAQQSMTLHAAELL